MDELRREQLFKIFASCPDGTVDRAWRESLAPDEQGYIAQLEDDYNYIEGVRQLCTVKLVRERIRQRFRPWQVWGMENIGDHCRLRLWNGDVYLAYLTAAGTLRLEAIG